MLSFLILYYAFLLAFWLDENYIFFSLTLFVVNLIAFFTGELAFLIATSIPFYLVLFTKKARTPSC